MNRHLTDRVETGFLTPTENFTFVSSSLVREVAQMGGTFLPSFIPTWPRRLGSNLGVEVLRSRSSRCSTRRRWAAITLAVCVVMGTCASAAPNRAAVASAHPLASEAGVEMLARGGNAFDAAVAVSAALGVVEPYGSGLGGGGFFLLHRASDGLDVLIDAREVAPAAASEGMYLDASGEPIPGASRNGPLAAGIPGLPAALVHLAENYGRLPLSESLQPAIRLAEQGFPAYDWHLTRLDRRAENMNDAALAVFLPAGAPPAQGSPVRQVDLGETLRALASAGRDGFYRGAVARQLVDGVREGGGIWSAEDLANYELWNANLFGAYQGVTIVSVPPPSSGGVALINMFNMLAGYDLQSTDRVTRTHLLVEIMRRTYRDRGQYLGDRILSTFRWTCAASVLCGGTTLESAYGPGDTEWGSAGIQPLETSGGNQTSHFSVLDRTVMSWRQPNPLTFPTVAGTWHRDGRFVEQ
ncbi:MAG: hypothetical protein CM1200mP36_04180 [Gammaproteobacteria bacterium]|nr:MAG: hypothetical protein CM1200mP36_04180 [Gammaproteobacteria bacterium]